MDSLAHDLIQNAGIIIAVVGMWLKMNSARKAQEQQIEDWRHDKDAADLSAKYERDALGKRIDSLEDERNSDRGRREKTYQRLEAIGKTLERVETKVGEIDGRVHRLEGRIDRFIERERDA